MPGEIAFSLQSGVALLLTARAAWLEGRDWSRRRRRHQEIARLIEGLCPACGYDLRATPQKGEGLLDRCPECGAATWPRGKPQPTFSRASHHRGRPPRRVRATAEVRR